MSTNSAIHGQETSMCSTPGNAPIIDRSFPAILYGKMSEGEWTSFCNDVDKTQAPVGPIKGQIVRSNRTLACGVFVLSAVYTFVIVGIFTATQAIRNSTRIGLYIFYGALCLGLLFYRIWAGTSVGAALSKCRKDLEEACERGSVKRHDVSFHVRAQISGGDDSNNRVGRKINYIKCSVGGAGAVGNNKMTLSAMEAGQMAAVSFPVGDPDFNVTTAAPMTTGHVNFQ